MTTTPGPTIPIACPQRPARRLTTSGLALLLAFAMVLVACGDGGEPDAPTEPGEAPVPADPGIPTEDLDAATEAALAQAATDFDVERDEIEVLAAESVTWPDGALGCPEPGMTYTQALVDGYRILLEVDGQQVAFHGARGGEPERCDDPSEPVS